SPQRPCHSSGPRLYTLFLHHPPPHQLYTLSLHDALPISHVLHTTYHEEVTLAGHDGLGRSVDSRHGRTTQTVDRLRRRSMGNAGQQGDLTGNVEALLQGLVYTAPDHIFHFVRVQLLVTLEQRLDQRGRQSLCTHVTEHAALRAAHRCSHTVDNNDVSWI